MGDFQLSLNSVYGIFSGFVAPARFYNDFFESGSGGFFIGEGQSVPPRGLPIGDNKVAVLEGKEGSGFLVCTLNRADAHSFTQAMYYATDWEDTDTYTYVSSSSSYVIDDILNDPNSRYCFAISEKYLSFGVMITDVRGGLRHGFPYTFVVETFERLKNNFGFEPVLEEVSDEYGEPAEEGGYKGGTFDKSSDVISIPVEPSTSVSKVGFVNVYKCDEQSLTALGLDLFPEFEPIDDDTGVVEALACVATNIGQGIKIMLNSQLINYIIDCHIIPVAPQSGGYEGIKIGFKTMSQSASKVVSDYVDFDCGTLRVGEYYNNFIDYAGTTAKLFLPFVGFVPVLPEWFQSGELSVKYRFNVIDGSFTAFVLSSSSKSQLKDTVVAQYGGVACVHVPITGANYSSMVSGLVGGAVSGTSGGLASSVVKGAMGVINARGTVDSSNGYSSTTAFLGMRKPYLMIERVVSQFPTNYAHENGLPANINAKLGDLTGFTSSSSMHIDIKEATESEREEIARLLAEGIVL